MRVLGIDYGDARVGLALSDTLGLTASPLPYLSAKDEKVLFARLNDIIDKNEVKKIVLGFPKNMNGTVGERGEVTLNFYEKLKGRCGVPVVLWDERLTTVSAERVLNETNVRGQKRKARIDSLSAVFILENFLNGNFLNND